MNVPLVDLRAQYKRIGDDLQCAINEVIQKTAFVGGPFVQKFEEEFADYVGCRFAVGVGNGTDALVMALRTLGLKPGDEIIVPALTFIASSEAVTLAGGKVVFADVDPVTRCLDPKAVEAALTERTKGIIAVHLYGHPADMDTLGAIAHRHDLWLIEDAAQAHGAHWNGKIVGSWGQAACFSFYPGKNLGAYGDAGMVVTQDPEIEEKVRMMANHGRQQKYGHLFEGANSRLDGIQAAILSVKLQRLDQWNHDRRRVAERYREQLDDLDLTLPRDHPGHVYHLFVLESPARDGLLAHLKEHGVGASVHYPDALPRLPAYSHLGHQAGEFPVAESLAGNILSLPVFPEMTEEQIGYVTDQVKAFFA